MSNLDDKYRKLTDREHVLNRPGMYIGSTALHTETLEVYNGSEIQQRSVTYNPGFIKLFDEIISNSVDEHRRNKKLNEIKVTLNLDTSEIIVLDNGGIPVKKHTKHKEWIPEMIFSNLRSGSNFDDSKDRDVAGTNGVGATLTNIFSNKFSISTCDQTNTFDQVFKNNMKDRTSPKISKGAKGFTKIAYFPDLSRFNMRSIDINSHDIIFKRCLDIAACNTRLTIVFTTIIDKKRSSNRLKFKDFKDFISLYNPGEFFYEKSKDFRIGIATSDSGFKNTSYVNSVHTKDGGTHVDYITNQLISQLREMIHKKHKIQVKPSDIRNHLHMFIDCTIINPSFSSQTKEKLITEHKLFKSEHILSEKTAKEVFGSEIIKSVLDWVERKALAAERAELRKLNKALDKGRVKKLIDAQKKGDRRNCILGIYEGDSATSAVRKFRDTQMMGAFPLKGKFINVHELPNSRVISNEEVKGLMGSIGLKLGEEPKGLRYGKIYIYTDADPDGNSIAAQLINFFAKYWPELFKIGMIYKVMTPLVVAKKGTKVVKIYTNLELANFIEKQGRFISKWDMEYKKGLAALTDIEYQEIIKNPNLVRLKIDEDSKDSLEAWFGRDSTPRKKRLLS